MRLKTVDEMRRMGQSPSKYPVIIPGFRLDLPGLLRCTHAAISPPSAIKLQ